MDVHRPGTCSCELSRLVCHSCRCRMRCVVLGPYRSTNSEMNWGSSTQWGASLPHCQKWKRKPCTVFGCRRVSTTTCRHRGSWYVAKHNQQDHYVYLYIHAGKCNIFCPVSAAVSIPRDHYCRHEPETQHTKPAIGSPLQRWQW